MCNCISDNELFMIQNNQKEVICKKCFKTIGLFRHNNHILHNNIMLCESCEKKR